MYWAKCITKEKASNTLFQFNFVNFKEFCKICSFSCAKFSCKFVLKLAMKFLYSTSVKFGVNFTWTLHEIQYFVLHQVLELKGAYNFRMQLWDSYFVVNQLLLHHNTDVVRFIIFFFTKCFRVLAEKLVIVLTQLSCLSSLIPVLLLGLLLWLFSLSCSLWWSLSFFLVLVLLFILLHV